MCDSTKFQINFVMNEFTKMKNRYEQLTIENANLVDAVRLLRERLQKIEQQKIDLIALMKSKMLQHQTKITSLQRENENLQSVVSEQNQTINDQSSTMNELRQEIEALKLNKEKSQLKNMITINSDSPEVIPSLNSNHQSSMATRFTIKKKQKNNTWNHPSLMTDDDHKRRKYKKKAQFRWPNLDISINNEDLPEINSSLNNSSLKLSKFDKKRKLYVEEDGTVDLNQEDED